MNSQEYDMLKKELLELKGELTDLDKELDEIQAECNDLRNEISAKEKALELLKNKAELIKPKKLDKKYIERKTTRLFVFILLLIVITYSLTTWSLAILIAILFNRSFPALVWLSLMPGGIIMYSMCFAEINNIIKKFASKIIQKKIDKIKGTPEVKEYVDLCGTVQAQEEIISQLKSKLNDKENKIFGLDMSKDYVFERIYEIEDMLIPSSNEETKGNSKKKIKNKQ